MNAAAILPTPEAERIAQVRQRVLAVVRASPGILTERAAAAACCSLVEVIQALEFLIDDGAVEEAELLEASAWFPMTWCHHCGCTQLHACDGGCAWTVEPGTLAGFGDLAGVCSRCA